MNCKAVNPDVDDDKAAVEKANDTACESAEGNAFDIKDMTIWICVIHSLISPSPNQNCS